VKTVHAALGDLSRKLDMHWHTWLHLEADTSGHGQQTPAAAVPTDAVQPVSAEQEPIAVVGTVFPLALPLGRLDAAALAADFAQVNRDALAWEQFGRERGAEVRWENRLVHGSTQRLATHLVITDLDHAVQLAGGLWPERLARSRERRAKLNTLFGGVPAALVRSASRLDEVDLEMLCTTAAWLRHNDPTGLTARQVPVEGVHGKWLNAHRRELLTLSGRDTLGLVERPSHVRYCYLDPAHRRRGGRLHDSHTLGDTSTPLYPPTIAVISENKDTALLFGELEAGISIFGNGDAALSQLPRVPWLRDIPVLVYWGDIDADGFEILDGLRAAGLAVASILMDVAAYEQYERYGSHTDATGKALKANQAKALQHLTGAEQQLYQRLVNPAWTRVRRIEQERIPLSHASAEVHTLMAELTSAAQEIR
jgi:hypothetical protein